MDDINVETELEFARSFYPKAVEGLKFKDYPPKPDVWLENWEELKNGWEAMKVQLIGIIESDQTDEEHRESLVSFLKCTLSIYLDLMCSISILMFEDDEAKEKLLKPSKMTDYEPEEIIDYEPEEIQVL